MKEMAAVISGFGGQGVLFLGKIIAYVGMLKGYEVSWLPSYGPEMRGGTANCSVCISDAPISSPLVTNPNTFLAMNLPSYQKFIGSVEPGGIVIFDNTVIEAPSSRQNLSIYGIPATKMSEREGLKGCTNLIMLGKLIQVTSLFTREEIQSVLEATVPKNRASLLKKNMSAVECGLAL